MTKPSGDKDYRATVRRILVSFLIVVPYILLFFFLERYGVIDNFTNDKKAVSSVQTLTKEIEALKAQLENANKTIAEKDAAVAEIEQLRLQFRQASDKASQSAAQLFAKTNEVDVLKAELKKLEEEKDSTESLKEEIEALKSERNIQWQKINEYTQALAAKDNEIESLSSSLNDTRNFANQLKGQLTQGLRQSPHLNFDIHGKLSSQG